MDFCRRSVLLSEYVVRIQELYVTMDRLYPNGIPEQREHSCTAEARQ